MQEKQPRIDKRRALIAAIVAAVLAAIGYYTGIDLSDQQDSITDTVETIIIDN